MQQIVNKNDFYKERAHQNSMLRATQYTLRFSYWGCLVARKWTEVRKYGSIIAHFPIYPNTGKKK